ncbi:MAG: endoglycosylceramidase [Actinomycetota bacterium]|jgi:endoglycosylceramidase
MPRGRSTAIAVTVLVVLSVGGAVARASTGAPPSNSAVVAPAGVVGHAGRWMVDADGKVVMIHGVNMATKWGPAYPAAQNFDEDDAALLAASGMNAVRLTVERYRVEPQAGVFDEAYVDHFADTVRLLADHGIMSLIDFHQDSWGPTFFDNGFPDWMTMTDGLPNLYQVGFPAQYFLNPALNRAFDHFWSNDVGPSGRRLQDDDAGILSHVASRLSSLDGVLGYEIMNEPWPGSQWPTCVVPAVGCPVFDQGAYSAYYANVIPKVRAADPNHLVWYEPLTMFNDGVPTNMTPPDDPNLGFAFHDYPLVCAGFDAGASAFGMPKPPPSTCNPFDSVVMDNAEAHSAATGSALLQTEFGATMDTPRIEQQLDVYDQHMMPWMFWSYSRYVDSYGANEVLDPADAAHVNAPMLKTLSRPYPQLVAGTPRGWNFDAASSTFALTYSTARADGGGAFGSDAETVVAVPNIAYPDGYDATVTGGQVVSSADAPVLRVRADDGADRVEVTVVPSGGHAVTPTNSACPQTATSAGGVGVDAAPYRVTGCQAGTGVVDGTVSASVDPTTGQGYVIQDGRPTNPNLLAGYIGVDTQHQLTLVGCAGGDYQPGAPDEWNQSPDSPDTNNAMASIGMGTFTAPSGPIGPTSPCSPPIVPTPSPGTQCGSPQDPAPAAIVPGNGSPLNVYTSGSPDGSTGVSGEFGGNDGASGYLQVTSSGDGTGNVTTGGTSKGGGGLVGVGNDGNETQDRWTPDGLPFAVCQH